MQHGQRTAKSKLSVGGEVSFTDTESYHEVFYGSQPTFINDTDCFYYSFTTREEKYYYVNPKKKEKRLLFDTPELLSKIAVYTKNTLLQLLICLSLS